MPNQVEALKRARTRMSVGLKPDSGETDGGDESQGGFEDNSWINNTFKKLNLLPEEIKKYYRIFNEMKNPPQWFVPAIRFQPRQSFGELALINDPHRAAPVK